MQQSSSSEDVDMESSIGARSDSCTSLSVVSTDIDGGSIDELSAKFSVQGTSSSKGSGKKKVVSYIAYLCKLSYLIILRKYISEYYVHLYRIVSYRKIFSSLCICSRHLRILNF